MFPGKYNKQAGNLFFSYESSGEQVYVAGGNPCPQRLMTAMVTDSNVPSENIWGRVFNQPSYILAWVSDPPTPDTKAT